MTLHNNSENRKKPFNYRNSTLTSPYQTSWLSTPILPSYSPIKKSFSYLKPIIPPITRIHTLSTFWGTLLWLFFSLQSSRFPLSPLNLSHKRLYVVKVSPTFRIKKKKTLFQLQIFSSSPFQPHCRKTVVYTFSFHFCFPILSTNYFSLESRLSALPEQSYPLSRLQLPSIMPMITKCTFLVSIFPVNSRSIISNYHC